MIDVVPDCAILSILECFIGAREKCSSAMSCARMNTLASELEAHVIHRILWCERFDPRAIELRHSDEKVQSRVDRVLAFHGLKSSVTKNGELRAFYQWYEVEVRFRLFAQTYNFRGVSIEELLGKVTPRSAGIALNFRDPRIHGELLASLDVEDITTKMPENVIRSASLVQTRDMGEVDGSGHLYLGEVLQAIEAMGTALPVELPSIGDF